MDKQRLAALSAQAAILKALAHPTRLFIVQELNKGEQCVCKFTEQIGADMSTVSRHLAILKNAGIIIDQKRGNQVFYTLKCSCVLDFLCCVETVIETNIQEQISRQNTP